MTWFFKTGCFCATLILVGFTLDVLGNTLWMCQQDCKDEPNDHLCGRFNFTSDSGQRNNVSVYQWMRNDCERKCFSDGDYERLATMDLCTKDGQNYMTYKCHKYTHPEKYNRCMKNESMN